MVVTAVVGAAVGAAGNVADAVVEDDAVVRLMHVAAVVAAVVMAAVVVAAVVAIEVLAALMVAGGVVVAATAVGSRLVAAVQAFKYISQSMPSVSTAAMSLSVENSMTVVYYGADRDIVRSRLVRRGR